MAVSASVIGAELSGMTIVVSEKLWKSAWWRTRGSLLRSFSDSARRWCESVSLADVRLKMARNPRREDERVCNVASLVAFIGHWVAKSLARRFTHGDGEYEDDTALRGAMFESGEEE
jgi:hypothetical protein